MRPSWDEYFLKIAEAVALRADCTRAQCGAVIVKHNRIVSTGYNGAPAGKPGCLEGACPRGRHYQRLTVMGELGSSLNPFRTIERCACGNEWPCPDYVKPRSSYDTGNGSCISIHAEANAIIYANLLECHGSAIYVTRDPCDGCMRLIQGALIQRVVTPDGSKSTWRESNPLPPA